MSTTATVPAPRGSVSEMFDQKNMLAGFLVFLIALPLCLGIAEASQFPPIAGVITAICGGIITSLISNSQLTIKGPAAGLIVIVSGAVTDFRTLVGDEPNAAFLAYKMVLAVAVVSGLIQIGFALFKLGVLGEFFPSAVVHGMLSAIGVIIISKQIHKVMGVGMPSSAEPLELLAHIPHSMMHMNPAIALIGFTSLAILFIFPMFKKLRRIPVPMVVCLVAIPLGRWLDLSHEHTYSFAGHDYQITEKYLVAVPNNLIATLAFPDFTALRHPMAWKWILLFSLIGSLESLLSAKAVDLIDPWKRRTNMNRDMLGVGIANTAAALIGGLPMISEIVRSKANIDNGARSRWANMWHGVFLLAFVALVPQLIHQIPLAALAAMLVYTGFRLASPREFVHAYHIGREQFIIFCVTCIGVFAIDLLVGVLLGVTVKFAIHMINGVPLHSFFKPFLDVEERGADAYVVHAHESAVFSNWIPFKRTLEDLGYSHRRNVIVDLSNTKLVDHSVMEKLSELQMDFEQEGLRLELVGLQSHSAIGQHPHAARRKGLVRRQRLTLTAPKSLREILEARINSANVVGYSISDCQQLARSEAEFCRIELVVPPDICSRLVDTLVVSVGAMNPELTICVETVYVVGHLATNWERQCDEDSARQPVEAHG